jgi:hypothetical protein
MKQISFRNLKKLLGNSEPVADDLVQARPDILTTAKEVSQAVPPTSSVVSKPLAALAGLTGGALVGDSFLSEDTQEPLLAQPAAKKEELKALLPELKKEEKQIKKEVSKPEGKSSESKESTKETPKVEEGSSADVMNRYMKMVEDAQKRKEQDMEDARLLAGSERFAAGMSGGLIDANHSASNKLIDQAKERASGVNDRIKADQQDRELKKEVDLDDPNNKAIPVVRDAMKKAFGVDLPEGITLNQLTKMGINVSNILTQKEAIDARKETAQLQREYMGMKRDQDMSHKVQTSVDKMTSELLKSDAYKGLQSADQALSMIDLAIETGDKTAGGAGFMQFAKNAQGDTSVVRDGDMRVLAGGYNYLNPRDMITKLAAKAQGGNFSAEEFKQMKQVVDLTKRIKQKHVETRLAPIRERSTAHGLDLSHTIPSDLIGGNVPKEPEDKIVTVTRVSDGMKKKMPLSSTLKMDKSKYQVSE